jgi:hypothetical protein
MGRFLAWRASGAYDLRPLIMRIRRSKASAPKRSISTKHQVQTALVLIWILGACAPFQASPQVEPSPTLTAELAAASSSPSPSPEPTSTPSPTATQTPTPKPTQTPAPTFTPTPDLTAAAQVELIMESEQPQITARSASPDGLWQVELVRYECLPTGEDQEQAYELLRLVREEDGHEKILADQLQNCGGLGAYGLGIVHWAADSQALYYTTSAHGLPDGLAFSWYPPLFRYDLSKEETTSLRLGPLARDGVTMAYPNNQEMVLYLWDLDRGEIARFPATLPAGLPSASIYDIHWSRDGGSLIYIEAENANAGSGQARLVKLDLTSFEQQVIYEVEDGTLFWVLWDGGREIHFMVNFESRQLTLPQVEQGLERPTSLWCERPDDLDEKIVALTRLPGVADFSCIVWADDKAVDDLEGYLVELKYENSGEHFKYYAGPFGTQWILPFEIRPRLNESQEQHRRRQDLDLSVYMLRADGRQTLLGNMGLVVTDHDFLSLPTATPAP